MHKRQLKLDCNSCMLGTIQNIVLCMRAVHADPSTSSSLSAPGGPNGIFFSPNTTPDMLSVTAGSIIILRTERCLSPAVFSSSRGQSEKEKERPRLDESRMLPNRSFNGAEKKMSSSPLHCERMGRSGGHAHLRSSTGEMSVAIV